MNTRYYCAILLASFAYVTNVHSSPLFDTQKISQEFSLNSAQEDSSQKDQTNQNTRIGFWDAARGKKMTDLKPEKESKLEKFLMGYDEGRLGLGWHGLYPKFGGIDSAGGAGLAAGVRFWRRELFGTPLEVQAQYLYSIRKYQVGAIQFGRVMKSDVHRLLGTRGYGGLNNFTGLDRKTYNFFLYATYRYRDFGQENFFGLGPDSLEGARTDYRQKDSSIYGTIGYRLTSWALLAGSSGYTKVELSPGKDSRFPDTQNVFDDLTAPGIFEDSDFIYGGGAFVIDLRDRPSNPHSGFMFGFEHYKYSDNGNTNFSFSRTSYDARGYLPLGAEHRTIALQLYTSMNEPDSGNRVPFYFLETLGGPDSLRGFDKMRFRDENLIATSAEYRWEAAPFWELAFFYDAGKVFPNGASWNLKNLENGYGFGMRFKLPKTVLLRFDIGRSNEGTHFYFRLSSPSF